MVTVIDATDLRLGRLASIVAKRALMGEEIAIINAENAVVSGAKARVLGDYDRKRRRGSREGGPFFPRRPEHIIKRTVRGMLPYKRQRGAEALKLVKIYVGVPVQFAEAEVEIIESAHIDGLSTPKYVTIGAVSKSLGAKF
ncbi:50S ribosomal protein L13 [Methanomicrobium antiquum]|jgi:large subunit ribosomal protein L13|uniref:Large ribosomal subunit protein uL13 n=1 Tax=Methanomicrobium antiquum TaxID=487686 RepID=A0AAF0FQK6_9EURY|nr:50S ribosomal protein L13 [Methanomicrobium antiquum]MDD3976599.1 50S ribosomal protein L13 [Methanomicrobium sp.]WFN36036.1 50S ribosomal protein L13 [Methanomicrobium antiquum]